MLMDLIFVLISHHLDFASYFYFKAILYPRVPRSVEYIFEPAKGMSKIDMLNMKDKPHVPWYPVPNQ